MKLAFFGTPDFASAHLEALINAGHEVAFVLCRADKPVGRKKVMTPPPVKVVATEHNIPVYQNESLKDNAILDILEKYNPELICVVAYGRILPEYVLSYPKYGCINVHGSLLPKYRGASPIQSAIINGETITGIGIMQMDAGLDTGDVIYEEKCAIDIDDNAETLFNKLEEIGKKSLIKAIEIIEAGKVVRKPQNHEEATYAAMLNQEMSVIDFTKSAIEIHNLIRGTYPWPCASAFLDGKKFKFLKSTLAKGEGKPGEVLVSDAKNGLIIATGDGAVKIEIIKAEGGKALATSDYLRGHAIEKGSIFGKE